jgi:hypothetical protein
LSWIIIYVKTPVIFHSSYIHHKNNISLHFLIFFDYLVSIILYSITCVRQCHKPPMTMIEIPPIKMVMTWWWSVVLPTFYKF